MHNTHQVQIAQVNQVNKYFGEKQVLNDVNMSLYEGEVLAILGPNGAGKTTLINLMLGRLSLSAGTMEIFGRQPGDIQVKRLCGTMLQVSSLPDMSTVAEHIQLFQSYYADPMAYDDVIALSGLEKVQDQYSKNLSGGQKQRLLFALAICGNPQLLFLDEPSVGMDINARKSLWKTIIDLKNKGKTIVLTTHYLEEADQLADRIVMLNQGQVIYHGTPDDVKSRINRRKICFVSTDTIDQFVDLAPGDVIESSGKFFYIHSDDPVATLKKLFDKTDNITDLSITAAALEDAFILLNETSKPRKSSVIQF